MQYAGDAPHVVVVDETEQVLALVERPVFGAKLPLQAVDDFKEVHGVERRVEALVAFVIRTAMEHVGVDPLVVVAVECLAEQEEVDADFLCLAAQAAEEVLFEAVGHVETQTVNAELFDPEVYAVQEVVDHGGVAEIQLDQGVMPLPTLVPETVVVGGVAVEVNQEPVAVGRIPFPGAHVAERPKIPPDVVEYGVDDDLDSGGVTLLDKRAEVGVGAQAVVDTPIVAGIVAVGIAQEYRGQIQRVDA